MSDQMTRKLLILAVLLVVCLFVFAGCDKRDDKDIEVSKYDINVVFTSQWDIRSYNGYQCVFIEKQKDEQGVYTITLKFEQLDKEVEYVGEW